MGKLQFRVIEKEVEAKEIWEKFSPHKNIDDEWDFRYAWFKGLESPLHFIAGFDGDKLIGLLALQFNQVKGLDAVLLKMDRPFLEFFGGIDTDDNEVFLAQGYEDCEIQFLEQIHEPAFLASLSKQYSVDDFESEFYLDRFEVNLEGARGFGDYVDRNLTGKDRAKVKHELNLMHNKLRDYMIEIKDGDERDMEQLFKFSMDRFGDRSSFHRAERRQAYFDLAKLFKVDIYKVILNGEIKAVAYGLIYNNVYTGVNFGYDYSIPSFGKFVLTTWVNRAVELGCRVCDVGQGDNGYKSRLRLTQVPQYKLLLNI